MPLARRRQTKFTYTMTRIMDADNMRELAWKTFNLKNIMKELNDVHNLACRLTLMLSMKQLRIINTNKCCA